MTTHSQPGLQAGLFNYISKPVTEGQFAHALDAAMIFPQAAAELATTKDREI